MYCKSCGQQIDADSAFCKFCGASQSSGGSSASETAWDTCEIETGGQQVSAFKRQFWAKAFSSSGKMYNAGESPAYSVGIFDATSDAPSGNDKARAAHDALVSQLIGKGWQREGLGKYWYSDRFRRISNK